MSSPVPSPVPAGTEPLDDAARRLRWLAIFQAITKWTNEVDPKAKVIWAHESDLARRIEAALDDLDARLAAVVSSSPATPHGPMCPCAFCDNPAAPSPATPEGGRERDAWIRAGGDPQKFLIAHMEPRRDWSISPASPAETREGRAQVERVAEKAWEQLREAWDVWEQTAREIEARAGAAQRGADAEDRSHPAHHRLDGRASGLRLAARIVRLASRAPSLPGEQPGGQER